jgi:hypothetical protein
VITLIKKFFLKSYNYLLKKFDRFIFLPIIIIPLLKKHYSLSKNISILPAFRCFILMDNVQIFKVPLRKNSTIEIEVELRKKVIQIWPELSTILVECELKNHGLIKTLSMPRYKKISLDESIEKGLELYNKLHNYSTPNESGINIQNSSQMNCGLQIIKSLYSQAIYNNIQLVIEKYLKNNNYSVGFAHGDFHSRNILLDDFGNIRLIDLDCMRMIGIQNIDALYFVLEYEWSRTGALWYDTLAKLLNDTASDKTRERLSLFKLKDSVGLYLVYLVDRVGQEKVNYGIEYGRRNLDSVIQAITHKIIN